jgi:hypothetical protein
VLPPAYSSWIFGSAWVLTLLRSWGGAAERLVTGRGHRVILRTEQK